MLNFYFYLQQELKLFQCELHRGQQEKGETGWLVMNQQELHHQQEERCLVIDQHCLHHDYSDHQEEGWLVLDHQDHHHHCPQLLLFEKIHYMISVLKILHQAMTLVLVGICLPLLDISNRKPFHMQLTVGC